MVLFNVDAWCGYWHELLLHHSLPNASKTVLWLLRGFHQYTPELTLSVLQKGRGVKSVDLV